ncbi:tRNA lysidine(34) synthetase TilS [Acinetobacter sp. MD2(2019)]|uniref:tRNA lysidine(34) synthetase TilS n=1 Tax=Acinetobacter sp. MD2(2019) TaxID=2605273 RepID=UPI002D1F336A|nr:tRNA lysidine(34) synthetase TilS [Acinetobacter sp. MD2(2019)]MEB3753662.1 tRNA lysidine(34) synthetase TilS [Acinetobacter sp. MD2(2019)]
MRSTLSTFNEIWQQQLRARVLKQAERYPQKKFVIGCSGGMDSMLLLHLMSVLFPHQIRAIYIDHQLQAPSSAWGEMVHQYCTAQNIPCSIFAVHVEQGNLEQQARHARYAAFQDSIDHNEVLLLAHHQQDQAETVMLRLFSGAGVAGLSGMRQQDWRENMHIWRPILDLSREQIEIWVAELNLPYVVDPTNQDQHYDRAWCRETVWPMLKQRFAQMQNAVARTASLMQDADEILNEVAQQDWLHCGDANALDLAALSTLSAARQRQLLSLWMKGDLVYRPSLDMVNRLQSEVIDSKADSQAVLSFNSIYFVRFQQKIYRLSAAEYLADQSSLVDETICCQLQQTIVTASGAYALALDQDMGLALSLIGQNLTLHPRRGGEKVHLYGRVGTWPLKKAIQDAKIFPWLRHQVQILSKDDVILGVFSPNGFWLAQSSYCQLGGWKPKQISAL